MKQGPSPDKYDQDQDNHYMYEWSEGDDQEDHQSLLKEFRKKNFEDNEAGIKQVKPAQTDLSKYDLNVQPIFHQRNKGLSENICFCCTEKCDLNRREIKYYYKFKDSMVDTYDEAKQSHEELLKDFYQKVFNKSSVPEKIQSDEWVDIGFQGKNPRNDFRGGGILSLHCLRYYLAVYPEYFSEIRYEKTKTFFFAITSINVTHMLITYLYMNKNQVTEHIKKVRAGRKQFKRFAKLNAFSKKAFYELHAFMFTLVYRIWEKEYREQRPQVPNFNTVLDQARQQLHQFLENRILIDINAFSTSWNLHVMKKYQHNE